MCGKLTAGDGAKQHFTWLASYCTKVQYILFGISINIYFGMVLHITLYGRRSFGPALSIRVLGKGAHELLKF